MPVVNRPSAAGISGSGRALETFEFVGDLVYLPLQRTDFLRLIHLLARAGQLLPELLQPLLQDVDFLLGLLFHRPPLGLDPLLAARRFIGAAISRAEQSTLDFVRNQVQRAKIRFVKDDFVDDAIGTAFFRRMLTRRRLDSIDFG